MHFSSILNAFIYFHLFVVVENAIPGAYQQTCMNLDERSFVLQSTGDVIVIYQGTNWTSGTNNKKGGGTTTGRTGGECELVIVLFFF